MRVDAPPSPLMSSNFRCPHCGAGDFRARVLDESDPKKPETITLDCPECGLRFAIALTYGAATTGAT